MTYSRPYPIYILNWIMIWCPEAHKCIEKGRPCLEDPTSSYRPSPVVGTSHALLNHIGFEIHVSKEELPHSWSSSVECPGSVWAYIVGQDSCDSKSNRLHVDENFRFCFHSFEEAYSSIYSSKMIGDSPEVSIFNWLFLKLNRLICN